MMDPLRLALRYHAVGLSVFSRPHGRKWGTEPWKHWQDQRPTEDELREMFGNGPVNTALAFGTASGNLIGLDADNPQRYAEVLAMLEGLGIVTWIVRRPPAEGQFAGHNGGGLILLRTPERATGKGMRGLDVRSLGYSLVPISRHPDGVDYYTEAGGSESIFTLPSLAVLAPWIDLKPRKPLPSRAALEAQLVETGKIPPLAWRILSGNSETIAGYDTRSEAEFACLCSLVNAGHDFESCKRLFLAYPAAGKFAEKYIRSQREAIAWLEYSYRKAAEFVLSNAGPARELARKLRRQAESQPWPGRTGATDQAVYLAHLSIVEKCGKEIYGASCREMAELAAVGLPTASRANHRLQDLGLLQLVQPATHNLPNRFRLVDVTGSAEWNTLSPYTVRECSTTHIFRHDAFRWSGLNKSGAQVWSVFLERGEATEKELKQATGRSIATIEKKLKIMFRLGMVEPLGSGVWRALPDVDLDAVAEELGTAGTGEAQKRRHREQRERRGRELAHDGLRNYRRRRHSSE